MPANRNPLKFIVITLVMSFSFTTVSCQGGNQKEKTSTVQSDETTMGLMGVLGMMLMAKGKTPDVFVPLMFLHTFTSIPVDGLFKDGQGMKVSLFEADMKKIAEKVNIKLNEQHLKENQASMKSVFSMTTAYFEDKQNGYLESVDSKLARIGDISHRTTEVIHQLDLHGLAGAKNRLLAQSLLIRLDFEEANITGNRERNSSLIPIEEANKMIETDRANLTDFVDNLANTAPSRNKQESAIYEVHWTSHEKGRKSNHHYKLCYQLSDELDEVCTETKTCTARNESNVNCKSLRSIILDRTLTTFRESYKTAATEYYEELIWEDVETVYQALDEAKKVVAGEEEIDDSNSIDPDSDAPPEVEEDAEDMNVEEIPVESASLTISEVEDEMARLTIGFPRRIPVGYTFGIQAAAEFSAVLISPEQVGYDPKTRSFDLKKSAQKFELTIKSNLIEKTMTPSEVKTVLDLKLL